MTLEEAIKHCQDNVKTECASGNVACAEEHKELSLWLIELKKRRDAEKNINRKN